MLVRLVRPYAPSAAQLLTKFLKLSKSRPKISINAHLLVGCGATSFPFCSAELQLLIPIFPAPLFSRFLENPGERFCDFTLRFSWPVIYLGHNDLNLGRER